MLPSRLRIWWLSPAWTCLFFLLPFAFAAYFLSDATYELNWRNRRFFDEMDLLYCFGCAAAFLIGGLFARAALRPARMTKEWGKFSPREIQFVRRMFYIFLVPTLLAYVIWTATAVKNGVSLSMFLQQFGGEGASTTETRQMISTIPGITTATQFGMALTILGTILCFNGEYKNIRWGMAAVVVLALLRSFIVFERLAIIEVIIPPFILALYYCRRRLARYVHGLAGVLWPFFAVVGVYLLFTLTESSRSWAFYKDQGGYSSVWAFTFARLIGYYVTALNNGSILYAALGRSTAPFSTFDWLFRFPVIGGQVGLHVKAGPDLNASDILSLEVNPEFNNPSAVFAYAFDWGEWGALGFLMLAGIFVFHAYHRFLQGRWFGLLLYPFVFTGITEIARVPYWTSSRAFPSWALLFFVLFGLRRSRRMVGSIRTKKAIALPIEADPIDSAAGAPVPSPVGHEGEIAAIRPDAQPSL